MKKGLLFSFMAIIALCAIIGCDSELPKLPGNIPDELPVPKADQVLITFDLDYDGAKNPAPIVVYKDEELGELLPTVAGRVDGNGNLIAHFLGWYDEDNHQITAASYFWEIYPDDSNTDEIKHWVLTARWEGRLTVTFDLGYANAPAPPPPVTLTAGSSMGAQFPAEPTRTDHEFIGWFNGATEITASTAITQSITVTAQWEAQVIVTFFLYEGAPAGDVPPSVNLKKGTTLGNELPINIPIRAGFEFDGWFIGETEATSATVINENVIITAKWTEAAEDYAVFRSKNNAMALWRFTIPDGETLGSYTKIVAAFRIDAQHHGFSANINCRAYGRYQTSQISTTSRTGYQYSTYGSTLNAPCLLNNMNSGVRVTNVIALANTWYTKEFSFTGNRHADYNADNFPTGATGTMFFGCGLSSSSTDGGEADFVYEVKNIYLSNADGSKILPTEGNVFSGRSYYVCNVSTDFDRLDNY